MATIPEGMVQLNVPIPEDLRDLIDSEIIKRCGYPKRGILGEIVTEALREFLYKRHTHTQTIKKDEGLMSLRSNNKSSAKYNLLKDSINTYGQTHDHKISLSQLNDYIKNLFGRDRRTVKRYIELLEEDIFICPIGKELYSTPNEAYTKKNVMV